jgi:hypothetical protein
LEHCNYRGEKSVKIAGFSSMVIDSAASSASMGIENNLAPVGQNT